MFPKIASWVVALNVINIGIAFGYLSLSIISFLKYFRTTKATTFLSFHLFAIAWILIYVILYYNVKLIDLPWLTPIHLFASYAIGPSFYLYISALLKPRKPLNGGYIWHYLPSLISFFLMFLFSITRKNGLSEFTRDIYSAGHPYIIIIPSSVFIHLFVYVSLTIRKTKVFNYEEEKPANVSPCTYTFVRLFIVVTAIQLGTIFFPVLICYYVDTALFIPIMTVPKLWIVYRTFLRKSKMLKGHLLDANIYAIESKCNVSQNKCNAKELFHQMEVVKNDKLYCKTGLNLNEVAKIIGTKPYLISSFLNKEMNTNFYCYINSLRVEEAKQLLRSEKSKAYTLEYLGYLAGFKSKSVFFTQFKRNTGVTPLQWLEMGEKKF